MTAARLAPGAGEVAGWCGPRSAAWRDALRRVPHDCYHLPAYVDTDARTMTEGTPCAFRYDDGAQVFFVPLVVRAIPHSNRRDAVSPYGYPGPVASTDDRAFWSRALRAFADSLRADGIVSCFVRLHPLLAPPLDELSRCGRVVRHGATVSIDLRRPWDEVYAGFRTNHRRQITRTTLRGRTVTLDEWDRLDEFIDVYTDTMRRVAAGRGYFLPHSYFVRLRTLLADHVHLMLVHGPGARILAGGLFLENDGLVQYHLGATATAALGEQPAKLMMAEACRWAQRRGASVLHLGGGVGGSETDGLFHFKAGFSDRRHAFHTWRLVIDPTAYRVLSLANGAASDPTFFPGYRRPAPG